MIMLLMSFSEKFPPKNQMAMLEGMLIAEALVKYCQCASQEDYFHLPSSMKPPMKSEEALQIAMKRREAKSKGEKETYKHLNAEFQRIARRDKKAFLRDQCKEIEENNRMGKTRDLFKKTRGTKGTFHAKMGTIKERMVWT